MSSTLFFIAWIASGTIHMQGIMSGSLSIGDGNNSGSACDKLAQMTSTGIDAHLYEIAESKYGMCDWGCEYPVDVQEMECQKKTVPAKEETILVPR